MIDQYIRLLAKEYLAVCDLLTSHHYHSDDERAALSAQRSWTHDELVRVLGTAYARPFDMRAYCRQIIITTTPALEG